MQFLIDTDLADMIIHDELVMHDIMDFLLQHGEIINLSDEDKILQEQYKIGTEMCRRGKTVISVE